MDAATLDMKRIQVQPGMTLDRVIEQSGSEAKSYRACRPDGFRWPPFGARACSRARRHLLDGLADPAQGHASMTECGAPRRLHCWGSTTADCMTARWMAKD